MSTPETRESVDPLAALAEEERAEREAIDAEHAANQEAQRAAEAEQRAAADAGEEPDEGEEPEEELEEEDEPRLYAGKYRTVEEMERAYTEAQSTIGRLGNEIGQVRQMVERQQSGGQQATPAGQQGDQPMSKEELDEWMVEDPVGATFYLAQLAARAQAEEQNQLMQPVIAQVNNNAAASALDQVKRELGPNGDMLLERGREALIAAMEQDRDHFVDPATRVRHMKEAVLAAAWEGGYLPTADAKPATTSRRRSARDVHVEGGSGAQPRSAGGREPELSPEEQELQDLHPVTGWHRPVDEKGIPLPIGPVG